MRIAGESLSDVNIHKGDQILVLKVGSFEEVMVFRDMVLIVYLPSTGELMAKQVVNEGGVLKLKSYSQEIADMLADGDDVEIQGMMIRRLPEERETLKKASDMGP